MSIRTGTQIITPLNPPASRGRSEHPAPSPSAGRAGVGFRLTPVEDLHPGDWVCGLNNQPQRVLRVNHQPYCGKLIGLKHAQSDITLWLTPDHLVLTPRRVTALSEHGGWRDITHTQFRHARELRNDASPPERVLWKMLRSFQVGVKFRRQHPIGPYIADFYTRDAALVVEVDGNQHYESDDAIAHDQQRDAFMQSLGLQVLRFSASEVARNPHGVLEAISRACEEMVLPDDQGKQWRFVQGLMKGDMVFHGLDLRVAAITRIDHVEEKTTVCDIEVDHGRFILSEICGIQSCGTE